MNVYLTYLEWPEKCFRVDTEALRLLRTLVPKGSRIVRARTEAAFLKVLPRATHVICWHFRRDWYARAPKLRVLATPGAGRELVSRDAPKGVRIHFGGFHGAIMGESVAAFVLAWSRGFFRPEAKLAWGRAELSDKCRTVAGTRAVIAGYGRVGRALGAKLASLGVEVFGYSRHLGVTSAQLDAQLRKADWLVLALPSDTGTDDFLDARRIAKLPRRCVVVNVGRGNAIDEAALLEALRKGRLAGAYLDVFMDEPGPLRAAAAAKGGTPQGVFLGLRPSERPWNLVKMPHAAAFAADYIQQCFRELSHDGCL